MAFKMKAGKEGPMKKNFGSILKKAIPDNAKGLSEMIKSEKGKKAVKNMGFTEDSSGALLKKGAFKKNGEVKQYDPYGNQFKQRMQEALDAKDLENLKNKKK
tara:strand:+ start:485 stop:790 length:306 start_codon:yes stop_codon:yes gene_type:complete